MRRQHVIEPTNSPHQSPVVLIPKSNGEICFCVDYRKINAYTVDDSFPMGNLPEMVRALGTARWFTKLGLKNGYWQVPLTERAKPATAFIIPSSAIHQFRVMAYGLKNAPMSFQRLMSQEVLAGFIGDFVMVYLDDIMVHSKTATEHIRHVGLVLERLALHNLVARLPKCKFVQRKTMFLGVVIDEDAN